MFTVKESEKEYRFGDSGPKYLMRGPRIGCGVVVLKPGQDFKGHYHKVMEENFFLLEGKLDFYIDDQKVRLDTGNHVQGSLAIGGLAHNGKPQLPPADHFLEQGAVGRFIIDQHDFDHGRPPDSS